MRRLLATVLLSTVTLTACGATSPSNTSTSTDRSYDVSGVKKVDSIAAVLPKKIKDKAKLTIGAAADYAPAEFRAEDLKTPIGYDVDLGKAIGKVLGVETEVSDGEFASLLPGVGSKFDIGISSFTITSQRTANYTMVSYITVGSSFAVKKGNPEGFTPGDVCGQSVGVQTGTFQEEEIARLSQECTKAGKSAVEVLKYAKQSDVTTNLVGGKIKAFFADSTVASYAVALTSDQLEVTGGVLDASAQGIVIAKDDPELAKAIQLAVQHLMDDGTWKAILKNWGVEKAALTTADVHPKR